MRTLFVSAALLSLLVLAAPAGAQQSDLPKELWSEYPLVQKVERAQSTPKSRTESTPELTAEPRAIGPLLPPADAAPAPGDSTNWGVWLAALALGSIVLLVAARTVPPVAASGLRAVGGGVRSLRSHTIPRPRPRSRKPKSKPMQLREHPPHPRAPASGRRTQYAPLPPVSVAEPELEREPRRYVVRRTGFLRSRFVVAADEPGGKVTRVASSRSFWRVGDAARQERSADDAWHELINDLRASGWEPSTQRSDFWVPLRRIDDGTTPILTTLEAYTLVSDDRDET
jgi:hypothetical protein